MQIIILITVIVDATQNFAIMMNMGLNTVNSNSKPPSFASSLNIAGGNNAKKHNA